MTNDRTHGLRRLEWPAIGALVAFSVVAVVGYRVYALHPENLPPVGFALDLYAVSFQLFAQVHIVIAFTVLAILLVSRTGASWIPSLLAVVLVSFTAEHVGTGYGFPFGGYEYTGLLGAKLGA